MNTSFLTRHRPALFAVLALSILLGIFGFVAREVIEGDTTNFDSAVSMLLRDNGNMLDPIGPAWLEEAGRDITSLGSFSILGIVVILVLLGLVMVRHYRAAAQAGFAVISGTILSSTLKHIFDRPRPEMAQAMRVFTSSFPSGHATISAVVYLTLGTLLAQYAQCRRLSGLCIGAAIFLTVLVGVSRVYLGVHYPTDVIAGWSIGSAWALLCWIGASVLKGRN